MTTPPPPTSLLTHPLPELMRCLNGHSVSTVDEWESLRRPEILELFRTHVYGRRPRFDASTLSFEVMEETVDPVGKDTLGRKVHIHYRGPNGSGVIECLLFIPLKVPKPAPGFVFICNRPKEDNLDFSRKIRSGMWPVEDIVGRGYFAAAFHYADVAPDSPSTSRTRTIHHLGLKPEGDTWGAISAWGWGASRILDYLETEPLVDSKKVGVIGHSRGGKTALWCAAEDPRFALAISNNSGCAGASLSRRDVGETIGRINSRFQYWFCQNFLDWSHRESKLPFDQHMLLALLAPRLVYVASGAADTWADPEGEFLSCLYADPAYRLYGQKGFSGTTFPETEQSFHEGRIGYHLREGGHGLLTGDWHKVMDFADRHFPEILS